MSACCKLATSPPTSIAPSTHHIELPLEAPSALLLELSFIEEDPLPLEDVLEGWLLAESLSLEPPLLSLSSVESLVSV
jgi:hypothetical protein